MHVSGRDLDRAAVAVQEFQLSENGVSYRKEQVESAISRWLALRIDRMADDLDDVLTTPSLPEFREFNQILVAEAAEAHSPMVQEDPSAVEQATEADVFSGRRAYSPERLAAMIRYFAAHGKEMYRTKLNKLLFYADLRFYTQNGVGISGATYVNLPYGPVADGVTTLFDDLVAAGEVSIIEEIEGSGRFAADADAVDLGPLSSDEIRELYAVLERYGDLTTKEIVDLSHEEMAYKYTRPGEPIAYEYGKFLKQ